MSHEFTTDDGTKVLLPVPHLSHSQIDMMIRCPRQYWYRYIEGLKEAPGFSLHMGLSGHGALEYNNLAKIAYGEDAPLTEVVDCMHNEWSTRFKEAQGEMMIVDPQKKFLRKATDKDVDASRQSLKALLTIYMEEDAPHINPVSAEESYLVDIAGIPVKAFTDLRTDKRVIDYKFGMSRSTRYAKPKSAAESLQLTLYSILSGVDKVGYYTFLPAQQLVTKRHPPEVKKVTATKSDNQRAAAEWVVQETAKNISKGSFPMCGDGNFLCSPNYCGFWHRCKGRLAKGKAPLVGEPKVRVFDEDPGPPPRLK